MFRDSECPVCLGRVFGWRDCETMAEYDAFLAQTQSHASRCDRAVFLLLIRYMVEELARPHLHLRLPFAARPVHTDLPDVGQQLPH